MATTAGYCRPIRRLAEHEGIKVVQGAGLKHGHYYIVGGDMIVMYPDWAGGRDISEGMIARQLWLMALDAVGLEVMGAGLQHMVLRALTRPALPVVDEGLAAD
jgi:hypothetical protein